MRIVVLFEHLNQHREQHDWDEESLVLCSYLYDDTILNIL